MTEATCRRELDLEIPAEAVQKAVERVAKEFARVARVPGFRPGKAPITLIRRKFADDIKSEVLQSLVPEQIERAVSENKMVPVTQPQVDKVDFAESGPVKFRATFEVLPEFELGQYKDLEVEASRTTRLKTRMWTKRSKNYATAPQHLSPPKPGPSPMAITRSSNLRAFLPGAVKRWRRRASSATWAAKKRWTPSTRICAAQIPAIIRISM